MSPVDIYITKSCLNLLQSLKGFDAFVEPYSFTVKWKSTKHSTLRMKWRLPCHFVNTPHRLEMEGGGAALWRKGTQGEDSVEINE